MHFLDSFIKLVDIIIWPMTILIILGWFRTELKSFFGNLKKIEASADGFVLESFEKQLAKTRALFTDVGTAKSAQPIGGSESVFSRDLTMSPLEQLQKWDSQLRSQILSKSRTDGHTAEEALVLLKTQGVITFSDFERLEQLLGLGKRTPTKVSQALLSELETFYNIASIE